MGACGSGPADPNAAVTSASPTKTGDFGSAQHVATTAQQHVSHAVTTANTSAGHVSNAATQASQYTNQGKAAVTNASTAATHTGTQVNSAVAQGTQLANTHAPAPVAGFVQSATAGVHGATTAATGGVNSLATGANSATNTVAAPVGSAVQTLQTKTTEATNHVNAANTAAISASQQAEAKAKEVATQGAGGLQQVSSTANHVAAGAPAPVASLVQPVASQIASASGTGATNLQRVNEPTATTTNSATGAVAPTTSASSSTSGTVPATSSSTTTSNILPSTSGTAPAASRDTSATSTSTAVSGATSGAHTTTTTTTSAVPSTTSVSNTTPATMLTTAPTVSSTAVPATSVPTTAVATTNTSATTSTATTGVNTNAFATTAAAAAFVPTNHTTTANSTTANTTANSTNTPAINTRSASNKNLLSVPSGSATTPRGGFSAMAAPFVPVATLAPAPHRDAPSSVTYSTNNAPTSNAFNNDAFANVRGSGVPALLAGAAANTATPAFNSGFAVPSTTAYPSKFGAPLPAFKAFPEPEYFAATAAKQNLGLAAPMAATDYSTANRRGDGLSVSTSTPAARVGGTNQSTFKAYPEAEPAAVVSPRESPVVSMDYMQTPSPSVRTPGPIVVNPNDSAAKQRMDLATINVRKLKKERAPVDVVTAAVDEFKAAQAAHASEVSSLAPTAEYESESSESDSARGSLSGRGTESFSGFDKQSSAHGRVGAANTAQRF